MDGRLRRERLLEAVTCVLATDDDAPFEWGVRDCLLLPANIVLDAIGIDPAEPFRGKYQDAHSASEVIGPKGLLWVSRQRARAMGANRVKVSEAQPGDWGVLKSSFGRGSVIKASGDFWLGCAAGYGGIALVKSNRVAAAWSFCE